MPRCSRKVDVLTHYDRTSSQLLPWVKGRVLFSLRNQEWIPLSVSGWSKCTTDPVPSWIPTSQQGGEVYLQVSKKEHLLYLVEKDLYNFSMSPERIQAPSSPDFISIGIESTDSEMESGMISLFHTLLQALKICGYIHASGRDSTLVLIPLDGKSDVADAEYVAAYLCKLARLMRPDVVTLGEIGEATYGKVHLHHAPQQVQTSLVPFSLVAGAHARVAISQPLEEYLGTDESSINLTDADHYAAEHQDAWKAFTKKKHSASELAKHLKPHYRFLVDE